MLEKLDSVGWSGLTHAYGTAEEIPAFIAALRSPDAEVRAEALDELWSCLLHEGLRFEADAYAVPFLADLAVDPATADRPVILHLLTAMAIGSDHPYLVTGFPIGRLRPRRTPSTSPGTCSTASGAAGRTTAAPPRAARSCGCTTRSASRCRASCRCWPIRTAPWPRRRRTCWPGSPSRPAPRSGRWWTRRSAAGCAATRG
ncbi:hypothetical protein ACFQY4_28670 [Catellatospora bangladeshensis]|uniref:hypothetical protein n=1 Tax=Catellatospora bangladeshensis TaxID=310355 RepID=UPI00361C4600